MSLDFLIALGFDSDPFASTNAADEPLIGQYFVEPPFFPAVVGDPRYPKSNVVFAPRGGGKTAQKIMIENRSENNTKFLCISYDKFPLDNVPNGGKVGADYHLVNLCRNLVMAILISIEANFGDSDKLSDLDKKIVVNCARDYLGGISAEKMKDSLNSIKTFGNKAFDIWEKYGGVFVSLLNAISARFGVGKIELSEINSGKIEESPRFRFESLVGISNRIGFDSVYILVDRVDELPFTANDAEKAFIFLQSILIDLPLLETKGVGFKFSFGIKRENTTKMQEGGRIGS